MADTQRTKSALATLLADNTSGDISPQDLRDLMESMALSYGGLYISSSAATSIGTSDTWTKVGGTTTTTNLNRFDSPASNRLRYTGSPAVHGVILATFSVTPAAADKVWQFSLHKNGSVVTPSIVEQKIEVTSVNDANLMVLTDVELTTNDYVELYVKNVTDTENVTVDHLSMFALGLFK